MPDIRNLAAMPLGGALAKAMIDYGALRDQIRACRGDVRRRSTC